MMKRFLCLLLALLLSVPAAFAEEAIDQKQRYETAQALYEKGQYWEAYEIFDELGKYEDSKKRASESKKKWKAQQYDEAMELYKAEQYLEAYAIFDTLDDYKESKKYRDRSKTRYNRAEFARAEALFDEGKYEEALVIYQALGRYHTSRDRAEETQKKIDAQNLAAYEQKCYDEGLALLQNGEWEAARDAFIQAGNHEGATEMMYEALYGMARRDTAAEAEAAFAAEDYHTAMYLYRALGDTANEQKSEQALRAQLLAKAEAETDPARAKVWYLSLGEAQKAGEIDCADDALSAAALEMANACEPLPAAIGVEEADAVILMNLDFEYALALQKLWKHEEANALLKPMGKYRDADLVKEPVTWMIPAVRFRDDHTTEKSEVFIAPDGSKHRYQIFKGVHKWVEAKVFCEILGGHLATMTTKEENDFVYWFMRDNKFLTAYFGLSDERRKGDWVWVTGEPFEYTNWHRGEPSRSGRERYGMYFYKHLKGTWNDAHFYEDAEVDPGCSFICEWEE